MTTFTMLRAFTYVKTITNRWGKSRKGMYAQTFHKGEWEARHSHPALSSRHLEGRGRRIRKEFRVSSAVESIRHQFGLHVLGVGWGRRILLIKMVNCICLLKELILMRLAWATDCSSVWENHLCIYNYTYIVSLRTVHTDRFLLLLLVCFCRA